MGQTSATPSLRGHVVGFCMHARAHTGIGAYFCTHAYCVICSHTHICTHTHTITYHYTYTHIHAERFIFQMFASSTSAVGRMHVNASKAAKVQRQFPQRHPSPLLHARIQTPQRQPQRHIYRQLSQRHPSPLLYARILTPQRYIYRQLPQRHQSTDKPLSD